MNCKRCKGTSIKSRRNYSHGNKSKPITSYTCRKCGSTEIELNVNKYGKRKRR